MTKPRILAESGRPAQNPAKDAATGGVATLIAVAVAGAIVANNPGVAMFHEAMIVVIAGILGGVGNYARSAGGIFKAALGWIG